MPGLALSQLTNQSLDQVSDSTLCSPERVSTKREDEVLHNLFSRIDRDKDGQISVVELRKAMTGRHKVENREMLAILGLDHKTIFAKLDANKDGYISFDEFQRVVSGKGVERYVVHNMTTASPSKSAPVTLVVEAQFAISKDAPESFTETVNITCDSTETVHTVKSMISEKLSFQHLWPHSHAMVLMSKSPQFRLGNEFRLVDYGIGGHYHLVASHSNRDYQFEEKSLTSIQQQVDETQSVVDPCYVSEDVLAADRRERVLNAKQQNSLNRMNIYIKFRSTACVCIEAEEQHTFKSLFDILCLQLPGGFREFCQPWKVGLNGNNGTELSSATLHTLSELGIQNGAVFVLCFGDNLEDRVHKCPAYDQSTHTWYWPDADFGQKCPQKANPQKNISSDPNLLSASTLQQWGWNADMRSNTIIDRD